MVCRTARRLNTYSYQLFSYSGFWLTSILFTFIVSMSIGTVLTVQTFRECPTKKILWKFRWNIIEVIWISGASISIFSVIFSSWLVFRSEIIDEVHRVIDNNIDLSTECVTQSYKSWCKYEVVSAEYCQWTNNFYSLNEDFSQNDLDEIMTWYVSLKVRPNSDHPNCSVLDGLYKASGLKRQLEYEQHVDYFNNDWINLLRLVWPHIFAFAFGLRFCRSIAAFRL